MTTFGRLIFSKIVHLKILFFLRMSRKAPNNKVDVVLGAQWGDEGKGKLVDMLSVDMDITARCAGGNNAGHTVLCNGIKVRI